MSIENRVPENPNEDIFAGYDPTSYKDFLFLERLIDTDPNLTDEQRKTRKLELMIHFNDGIFQQIKEGLND